MELEQTIHVTVETYRPTPILHIVEDDTDREIHIVVDDFAVPTGTTAVIEYYIEREAHTTPEATAEGNTFTFDATELIVNDGILPANLRINTADGSLRSFLFHLHIHTL